VNFSYFKITTATASENYVWNQEIKIRRNKINSTLQRLKTQFPVV